MRPIFKISSEIPQLTNLVSSNRSSYNPHDCDDLNHHFEDFSILINEHIKKKALNNYQQKSSSEFTPE